MSSATHAPWVLALALACGGDSSVSTAPEPTLRLLFQGRSEGEIEPCG